ncbi:AP2 domain-containing protein [Neobacillus mesonae]|uniref:AP2 domain-containing protein n=1 Tax=Neobacillus mesonae TaxID=1193713 RepID=UPI0020412A71|nr:AP2 domain-containing protein [Neobacillus mesonae]MCM3571410.1 AP2 domain-containing protein [Neobacillus mesonae]
MKRGNYTSQFKGVCFCRRSKKWIAQIHIEKGKQFKLGFFDDEKSAAKAYNEAAEIYHGEWPN